MKHLIHSIVFCLFLSSTAFAQDEKPKKYTINGYLSNMQSIIFEDFEGNWMNDNLIHNRLKLNGYLHENFTLRMDLRSRIFTGEQIKITPGYGKMIEKDAGLIDMNTNLINEKSIIFNSMIDRLYLSFEKGNLNITAGRQRINWGRSIVWNPNDLFNTYSYFDFDYPEKPGADALRLQYYTGPSSKLELAVKADSSERISAAALYKFTLKNFDLQVIGGLLNENDYAAGFGFESYIGSVSLRGEYSYLHPKSNMADTIGLSVMSISADYLFPNSLSLQAEFLYNQQTAENGIRNFMQYYAEPLNVKNLSFTEYNIFAGVTYPITPLFTAGISAMYYPEIKGFFIGPNLAYSMAQNFEFSFTGQTFSGEFPGITTGQTEQSQLSILFLRLKWNF